MQPVRAVGERISARNKGAQRPRTGNLGGAGRRSRLRGARRWLRGSAATEPPKASRQRNGPARGQDSAAQRPPGERHATWSAAPRGGPAAGGRRRQGTADEQDRARSRRARRPGSALGRRSVERDRGDEFRRAQREERDVHGAFLPVGDCRKLGGRRGPRLVAATPGHHLPALRLRRRVAARRRLLSVTARAPARNVNTAVASWTTEVASATHWSAFMTPSFLPLRAGRHPISGVWVGRQARRTQGTGGQIAERVRCAHGAAQRRRATPQPCSGWPERTAQRSGDGRTPRSVA